MIPKRIFTAAVGMSLFVFVICSAWTWMRWDDLDRQASTLSETLVVSNPSDPYYPLAQKIAQAEQLELVDTYSDVLKSTPQYVLLVSSPENITPEMFLEIGRSYSSTGYYPALGIITGSTIEKAEQLWARKDQVQAGQKFVAGDIEITQLVNGPTIFNISDTSVEETELTKASLIETLEQADYFYWSRHVGGKSWFWNSESENFGENDELRAADIPPLKPVVIYTPSCSSVRPWIKDSISLRFVDQGAAAYVGNPNSPFTNAFVKHGLAVHGLSSWKEFPLGMVAQVHNKMMARTIFTIPQFFMLGDPRIYLSNDQPYQILSDTTNADGKRVIQGQSDFKGVLAVKIANGAEYRFLLIPGVTSASDEDLFYNSKLQTLNLGQDKYILLLHEGGKFEIELSKNAPFGWLLTDALLDSFDYSWVVLWLDVKIIVNMFVYLIPIAIFLVILLYKLLRQKRSLRDYRLIFLLSFLYTLVRLAYFLLRWERYTSSANFANYTASQIVLGCIGIFACAFGGLILLQDARKLLSKIIAIAFAVLPQLALTSFYVLFLTLMNAIPQVTGMTAPWLISYNILWMILIVLFFEMLLIFGLHTIAVSRARVTSPSPSGLKPSTPAYTTGD